MDQLTIYFDRCFGKRVPEALGYARPPFRIEYHHSKTLRFKQNMSDDDWLAICGQKGWIAFTHDQQLHVRDVEIEAVKQHNVRGFYLFGASLPTWDKLVHFYQVYPKLVKIIKAEKPPYLFRTRPSGRGERVKLD